VVVLAEKCSRGASEVGLLELRTLWVVVKLARMSLADITVVVDGSTVLRHRMVEVENLTRHWGQNTKQKLKRATRM
jgi:hypothetical protein